MKKYNKPDHFDNLRLLNFICFKKKDFSSALDFINRAIKINPNFAEAWNKRATAYYMLGEYDKSMTDINITLKLEPRHFGAMDGMILIFLQKGKVDQAVKIYDEIIDPVTMNLHAKWSQEWRAQKEQAIATGDIALSLIHI